MKLPDKIPIERIKDYHTHYLGQCADGQLFWAYPTFAFTKKYEEIQAIAGDWRDYRNEYAILHMFDSEGNYLKTQHWFAGTNMQVDDNKLIAKLDEMVLELGDVEFKDITVNLFEVTIDGITFGLIPDPEFQLINLMPSSTIAFGEPWDGSYST